MIGGRGLLLQKKLEEASAPATSPSTSAPSSGENVQSKIEGGRGSLLMMRGRPRTGAETSAVQPGSSALQGVVERLSNMELKAPEPKAAVPMGMMGRGILRGRPIADTESVHSSATISTAPPPVKVTAEGDGQFPRRSRFELENVADSTHGGHSQMPPGGRAINVTTNYIQVKCASNTVYQYHVFFEPSLDSRVARMKLLYNLDANALNGVASSARAFDGRILYTPRPISTSDEPVLIRLKDGGRQYDLTIKLVAKSPLDACRSLLNILFKRIQGNLKMVQVGRNYFQPVNKIDLKNLNLEVWPGYEASLSRYEGGLMLLCDVSHRVVRMDTVHHLMLSLIPPNSTGTNPQFRTAFTEAVVGTSVLTRYNNRTYRVDDVAFGMTPLSTFTTADGQETTFARYYQEHYGITIKDSVQPLLISKCKVPHGDKGKTADSGRGTTIAASTSSGSDSGRARSARSEPEVRQLFLIPELCYQTGLNDAMRNNFQLMRSLHEHTRAAPMVRWDALMKFANNCREIPEAASILRAWGLEIEPTSKCVPGYQMPPEQIIYGRGRTGTAGDSAEFKRDIGRMPVIKAIPVERWIYIYQDRDERCASEFLAQLIDRGRCMGMAFSPPTIARIENDRTDSYIQKINALVNRQTQLVMCLMRVAREDRYNAIKKVLYVDLGIASQIVLCKTIGDPKKLGSVATNIALQITAKLGGELWAVPIPPSFPKIMVIGIDTYHEGFGQSRRSVGGLVGSLNGELTRYYSQANFQAPGQEMIDVLCPFIGNLLKHFYDRNHFLPETILVYRDGVSDSQMREVQQVEVAKMLLAFEAFARDFQPGYQPKLVFQVVQKRISTRIFSQGHKGEVTNPTPGVVVDKGITRADAYDFFLVPQSVRQGTATPSHYVVVHDSSRLTPNNVQAMAFKACHLYYNWPGTIRVPAPCQYAHKLAYMVGCNLRAPPKEDIRENLFYL